MGKGTQRVAEGESEDAWLGGHGDYDVGHAQEKKASATPGEIIFSATKESAARDFSTVVLVAGALVPFFTVLGPLVVALPFILASMSLRALGIYGKDSS